MQFLYVILLLVIALSLENGVKSSSLKAAANRPPLPAEICRKAPINNCKCHCNLRKDPQINEAITALGVKIEKLFTLINKTAAAVPKPSPLPGKASSKRFISLVHPSYFLSFFLFNIATGVPASSCRELFQNDK